MMHYTISYSDPESRFINLTWHIANIHQDEIQIQLPSWRPGRYELQNYAKNIRNFSVTDLNGKQVAFKKLTKDRWLIVSQGLNELKISYEYYANQPDAGASYLCKEYLYINPVNCMMYMEGRQDEPYTLKLEIPADYIVASQLKEKGKHTLEAESFDKLADSPFIAGASLQHHSFSINNGNNIIHFWLQGNHQLDLTRLEKDTRKYAEFQTRLFGEMPCKDYHFLYIIHDYIFRHGVEHMDSTVIVMGRTNETDDELFYHDLLAISSHELFHLWNIKRIRPQEMLPYDFTKENYSTLGYVYEGVTTYYGDLALLRCGVWTKEQYLDNLSNDLKRHFNNQGRFNYSVAESSWDTWLDGYVPGVPGRKVSIYVEGMIAAMIADIQLLNHSNGSNRLDQVMHHLYVHFAKKHIGYTEDDYQKSLEHFSGISFTEYMQTIIHGKSQMEQWLRESLESIGMKLTLTTTEEGILPLVRISDEINNDRNPILNKWWSDI